MRSKERSIWLTFLLALSFVIAAGLWLFVLWPWSGSTDYSAREPAMVFERVMGRSVPPGVSDLRVAGRSYPFGLKHWVYLRFRADEGAISALTRGNEQLSGRHRREAFEAPYVVNGRYERLDRKRVLWEEVRQVRQPEVYSTYGGSGGFVWCGYLLVDRERHVAYVGSNGD